MDSLARQVEQLARGQSQDWELPWHSGLGFWWGGSAPSTAQNGGEGITGWLCQGIAGASASQAVAQSSGV